jgi:hypothetical protein
MNTHELVAAAAAIAGPLTQRSFETGNIDPARVEEIARTAVEVVLEIEKQARKSQTR